MKTKIVVALLASTLWCISTFAQLNPAPSSTGNITVNASTCATTNACVVLHMATSNVGYSVTVSGTWTGTLTVEQSGDNQGSWTSATTTTANTLYTSALTPGITDVRVRGSAAMTGTAIVTITASGPATLQQITGGSSSSTSTGPVINVTNPIYAGGAASSNADNNAQFTSAFAAANTAVNPGIPGQSSIAAPLVATGATGGGGAVSLNIPINLVAGTTTLVFMADAVSHHVTTVTDTGGSTYTLVSPSQSNAAAGSMTIYATAAGGTKTSTSVTLTITGLETAEAAVMSYTGASLAINPLGANSGGAGTALSFSQTTLRAGSTIAMGCVFFNTNIATFSATTGNARGSVASTAGQAGIVAMDNSSIPIGSVPFAGTFSASTNTACLGIEVQSYGSSTQQPTVYFPAGYYVYSGGINPTIPMTLKGEPGATLCYTGSAHAVDIGPIGGAPSTAPIWPFYVDGLTFTCGPSMTQGVFWNSFTVIGGIRNSTFVNFGPAATGVNSPWAVAGNAAQWDLEIGPQNRFLTTDLIPRNYVRNNISGLDLNSFLRVHDSEFYCLAGPGGASGINCSSSQAGIAIYADGIQHIISLNSFGWMNPAIIISCNAGNNCYGSKIDNNVIDGHNACSGTGTCYPPVVFRNTMQGLVVQHNNFDLHASGLSPIGPFDGTSTLSGARINFNQASPISAATPFVLLNNLAGQTNNQSSNNQCNTTFGQSGSWTPCPLPHTVGANIANFTFNVDDQHVAGLYGTTTNCNVNSVSPAACGASPSGSVVVPTTTVTYTVNTTAVTASSRIILLPITDGSGLTGSPTCVAPPTPFVGYESARVAATSFTFTLPSTAGTSCWTYWIVN